MLNKTISTSGDAFGLTSDTNRLIHVYSISHLDRDGRISADPLAFKGTVVPVHEHITSHMCAFAMCDMVQNHLAYAYIDRHGRRVLCFPNFERHQVGMRYNREAPSRYESPKLDEQQSGTAAIPDWLIEQAGLPPGQNPFPITTVTYDHEPENRKSGPAPARTRSRLREGNVNQSNGSKSNTRAHEPDQPVDRDTESEPPPSTDRCPGSRPPDSQPEPPAAQPGDEYRGSSTPTPENISPSGLVILTEIQRHPVLAPLAHPVTAEQAVVNGANCGASLGETIRSLRELAAKASAASSVGAPWRLRELTDSFGSYTSRHSRVGHRYQQPVQRGDSPLRQQESQQAWDDSTEAAELTEQVKESGF